MQEKDLELKRVEITMGEGVVESAPCILLSSGIGSCVVVALYDMRKKIGGIAHIMLGDSGSMKNNITPYWCADTAIETLLGELLNKGTDMEYIAAKIAGGAQMFEKNGILSIGKENVKSVKHILRKKGIPLDGEDTGGRHGRSVELHLDSGTMFVKAIGKKDRVI